jgi:hypothetical protein
MRIREATNTDFNGIYRLLVRLNSTSLSKTDWEKITKVNFINSKMPFGYLIEDNSEILGFIGTIYSERYFDGKMYKFCNLHSWIVDTKARARGIDLLLTVLKKKDHIITNFTASEIPYTIFKSLKFKEIHFDVYKLFPLQSNINRRSVKIHCINDNNATALLEPDDYKLYQDHKQFKNTFFLFIKTVNASSFLIYKQKTYIPNILSNLKIVSWLFKTKMFLADVHYIRNEILFFEIFANSKNAIQICKAFGSLGILVSNRYLTSTLDLKIKLYPSKRPFLYRHTEDERLINTLYSELFILDI